MLMYKNNSDEFERKNCNVRINYLKKKKKLEIV